jgi:hypothetical protein
MEAPSVADIRELTKVWHNDRIPVVYREPGQKLKARLPYREGNRQWICLGRTIPVWVPSSKHWEIPISWFNNLINKSLRRFGAVYVIQAFNEKEVCAPACWSAKKHECSCSCLGANHGSQSGEQWRIVSETFAVRSGEKKFGCKLITLAPGFKADE